jgi:hypothetical protein
MGNGKSKTKHNNNTNYKFFSDKFRTYEDLQKALRDAGLESSQLIVGIDFTKSNTWQGGLPYYEKDCLHSAAPFPNPYQRVLSIMCKTLEPFDDDHLIPAYGFGDSHTIDKSVFPFLMRNDNGYVSDLPCVGLDGVFQAYSKIIHDIATGTIQMSGPTSFAPIIRKAIELVKLTNSYHILLIIADGTVDRKDDTIQAIIEASKYPLSIICVGVGKGPFDVMREFDDNIPKRDFDNFQFIDFYEVMTRAENQEIEFAKNALMEIPDQYKYIKNHLLR